MQISKIKPSEEGISTQTHPSARSKSVLLSDTAIKIPPPHVFSALTLSALKTRKETAVEARVVKPDLGQAEHMEVGGIDICKYFRSLRSKATNILVVNVKVCFANLKLAKPHSHAREMWSFICWVKRFFLQSLQCRWKILFLMHNY